MSPILTGIIIDNFDNRYDGYKWGMRLVFWWSIFGVIFMGFAWLVAYRKYSSGEDKEEKDLLEDELGQNMGDLVFQYIINTDPVGNNEKNGTKCVTR